MALVLAARNGILFLLAWESMALASFFLVVFEHEQRAARRRAGLPGGRAPGHRALLAAFVLLAAAVGSFEFEEFGASPPWPALTGLVFLLRSSARDQGRVMPLHVWLPEAHPPAPATSRR